MDNKFYPELFDAAPIIGIMRNLPPEHLAVITENYFQAGLTCLEITMNSAGAVENMAKLSKAYKGRLNIGAGTVCTMHELDKALNANAQFIVTPIINGEVIRACVSANVPVFPGAYTPSEIYKAWHSGATMVKVFPAGNLGAGYIKEVLAPLEYLKLLPTGGIGLANFNSYFTAGAKGVGIGSQLFPGDVIAREDWTALRQTFIRFKEQYTALIK